MKTVAFVLLFAAFAIATDSFAEWAAYKAKYNKLYGEQEENVRYRNFLASQTRIAEKNANATRPVFGLGPFSDMSPQEFRETMLMSTPIERRNPLKVMGNLERSKLRAAPADFDWRAQNPNPVTPVKDQEQCGSCWAFSVTETAESANILAGKANESVRAAPQQLVDCDQSDSGCNGGLPETAWQYIIGSGGLDSESSYPYTAEDGNCAFKRQDIAVSVKSWKYATSESDETTLQANLLTKPLSICVDASNWQDYSGGVMSAWDCAWVVELDHCVQLVGYSTTDGSTPYWIVRNSWNTNWGENGYIRLEKGTDCCGLTRESTMPFV